MATWLDRAEQLTYEGEEIAETVAAGDGGVVATTHRLLVFDPEGDGETFAGVDLPNVEDIEVIETGQGRYVLLAAQTGLVGTILLLAGALLPLDSLVGDVSLGSGASRIGAGGAIGLVETLLGILRSLDTLLLVAGALALLAAAGALGLYLRTRERQLRIERAGDDPLSLALGEARIPEERLERLRRASRPEP